MASNIVNKLIDSSETASSAKDPDKPYIKSVQQIPNKQGSNLYKVTPQPKSKISFQDDSKTLSCGQQMMKNLNFTQNSARIWIISYRTRNTNILKKRPQYTD